MFFSRNRIKDLSEATDFEIDNINNMTVASRIRRNEYYNNTQYRYEFTIRYKLHSGNITEIDKIKQGYAKFLFYGFLNNDETEIIQWVIMDLDYFRRGISNGVKPINIMINKDGYARLAVYNITQFAGNMIIAHKGLPTDLQHWIKRSTYNYEN